MILVKIIHDNYAGYILYSYAAAIIQARSSKLINGI